MITQRTRGAHAKCMKSKQALVGLQECENDKCKRCAKEREVKKSVRIELVKAQQRDSILNERYS
jgi:hypothetical protein